MAAGSTPQNVHRDRIICGGSQARERMLSSLRWAGLSVPTYPASRAGDRDLPAEGVTLRLAFEVPSFRRKKRGFFFPANRRLYCW